MGKKILGSGSFTIDDVLLRGVVGVENASDDLSVTRDVRIDGLDQLAGPGYCKNVQPYPESTVGAAGFALHGFGYVGGGTTFSSFVRQYNDISNVWTVVPGMGISPRIVLSAFVLNDLAYFCGGCTTFSAGSATSSVQCFNDAMGSVSVRVGLPRVVSWPSAWSGGGFGFVGGGDDFVDTTYTCTSEIDQYNDAVNNWSVCSGGLPVGREVMGTFVMDSYTYLAGGSTLGVYTSVVVRFDDSVGTCLTMNSNLPVVLQTTGSDDGVGGGYIVGGRDSGLNFRSDIYQFNAATVSFIRRDYLTVSALGYNATFGLNGCAYFGPSSGASAFSTVCQYRSATLFDVPGSFKRSTQMPSHVLVGTCLDGVSRSLPVQVSSDGRNWLSLSSNKFNALSVSAVMSAGLSWVSLGTQVGQTRVWALCSLGGGVVLAGTYSGGKILRSTDSGATWSDLGQQFGQTYVCSFCYLGGGVVLAGTGANAKILRSVDYGLSWVDLGQQFGLNEIRALCSLGGGVVLAGTGWSGRILRSVNYGLTWSDLGVMFSQLYVLSLCSLGGGVVLAGTANGGLILRSVDYGVTWSSLGQQFGQTYVNSFCSLGGGVVLAGASFGLILRSVDYGVTWVSLGAMFGQDQVVDLCSVGGGVVLAGTQPNSLILRSVDSGVTWVSLGAMFSQSTIWALCSVSGGVVLAGAGENGLILRSVSVSNCAVVFLPTDGLGVYDYKVRVGLPRMSSGGVYITTKPTPSGWTQASVTQGLQQNGFGYVDTGAGGLRKYDDAADYWSVASLSGTLVSKHYKAVFSVGGYGYWVGGADLNTGANLVNTVQRYDDASTVLSTMAVESGRYGASGATGTGGFGYVISGWNGTANTSSAVQYNTLLNSWSSASGVSSGRPYGGGFNVGNMVIYTGGIVYNSTIYSTISFFNEYTGVWSDTTPLPAGRAQCGAFDLNDNGYVGYGTSNISGTNFYNDVVRFSWAGIYCNTVAVGGTARANTAGFSLNDKGYFIGGTTEYGVMSFPENYARLGVTLRVDEVQGSRVNVRMSVLGAGALSVDEFPALAASSSQVGSAGDHVVTRMAKIATNSTGGNYWVTLGDLSKSITFVTGFSLNGFGYLCNFYTTTSFWLSEVVRFNDTLLLTEVRNNSINVSGSCGFVLNGYGYTVNESQLCSKYNDSLDSWVSRPLCTSVGYGSCGFSLNGFGYVCGGHVSVSNNLTSQFSDAMNVWVRRSSFFQPAVSSNGFALNGYGYVCGGQWESGFSSYVNVFNDASNVWIYRILGSFTARTMIQGETVLPSGGWHPSGSVGGTLSSECLIYDDQKWYWQQQATVPVLKCQCGLFCLNGLGYSCGGNSNLASIVALSGVQQFRQADYTLPGSFGHSRVASKRLSVGTSIDGRFTNTGVRVGSGGMGQAGTSLNVAGSLSVSSNSYSERVQTDLRASFSSVGTGFWKSVGDLPSAYRNQSGFSVAGFGYVVGGYDGSVSTSELDQYNDAVNAWSYKMNWGVNVHFLGNFVLSRVYTFYDVMKCYEHNANVWVTKSSPSSPISNVVGFALNGYGYSVAGAAGGVFYSHVVRYTEASGVWVAKASLIGSQTVRAYGAAAGTVGYGYMTCGIYNVSSATVSDHAQYNDTMNAWTLRAYYPKANGFAITSFCVLSGMPCCTGGGNNNVGYFSDSYAYNECLNVWSSRVALPAPVRGECPGGFALNNLGYVAGGYTSVGAANLSSVYQYQDGVRDYRVRVALPKFGVLNQGTFTRQRGNFPVTVNATYAFNLNGFGYAGGGQFSGTSTCSNFYQYAEPLDTWIASQNSLLSTGIMGGFTFALNGLGYTCGGVTYSGGSVVLSSAAFYNDVVRSWSSVQPCLAVRWGGTGFVLNGYGYVLGGRTDYGAAVCSSINRYNDSLNSWLAMTSLGTARSGVGFVLGGLGYMAGGYNGVWLMSTMSEFNDSGFYERITTYLISVDAQGSFSFKGYGYSVCGNVAGVPSSAVYRYNNDIAYWRRAEPIPPTATARYSIYSGFSTNNAGYTVGGHDGTNPQPSVFAICHQDEYVRVAATLKLED
jgi:hypothetical protein